MIIYKRKKKQLVIPCGLGPVVCENADYELQMKMVDSSTSLQQVEPDEGYYGLFRVIVNPYTAEWVNRPITGNGSYVITPENADALSGVEIDVDVQPSLQGKNVDSSTVAQDVTPDEGYDGLSQVTVNPYTLESKSQVITVNGEYTVSPTSADGLSSVDISVNIPDIPAVVQAKTADSSTEQQVITPDEGYDGLSSVTIDPYTLESKSDNITENGQYTYAADSADGLSQVTVDVSVDTVNNQSKSVDSSTEMQYVQPDQGYTGLDYVAVNPYTLDSKTVDSSTVQQIVTSDEDGLSSVTVNPYVLDSKTVDSSTVSQVINSSADGLSSVTVNPYILESKSDNITANGQYIYTADNADALSSVTVDVSINTVNNQSKTVDSSTVSQSVTPEQGYTGLDLVTVNPYTLDSKTVDSSTVSQVITSDEDGLSSVTVNPYVLDSKTVDSSTVQQIVTSDDDGLSSVTVNPYVLESKSDNITVNGQYTYTADSADALSSVTVDVSINTVNNQSKTVDSSTVSQSVTPDQGYTGLDSVTVEPYVLDSKTVDVSTVQQVITSDEDGLSSVTVNAMNLQSKRYDPYHYSQYNQAVFPDSSYDGLEKVVIAEPGIAVLTVDSSTVYQEIDPNDKSADYFWRVKVNPYTTESDSSTLTVNGQYTFTPQNADALSSVTVDVSINTVNNQSKTVDSSTVSQSVTPDQGYTGLDSVTVEPYVLDNKTVNPSTNVQVVTSDEDGLSSVTVNAIIPSTLTANSSTVAQEFTPIFPNQWFNDVIVNPYSVESDSSVLTVNGQYTFTPQNADALSSVTVDVSIYTVNNQSKTVDSSTVSQSIMPDSGYTGLDSVTVNPYVLDSKTVDSSTVQQIVTSDEDGLSSVTVNPYTIHNQDKELKIVDGRYESVITPDSSYDGLSSVSISTPSSYFNVYSQGKGSFDIDINRYITYINVRDLRLQSDRVADPSTSVQVIYPEKKHESWANADVSYDGLWNVTVNPVTAAIDSNIQSENIKTGVQILGVTGSYAGQQINNQSKTVNSSTSSQTVMPDSGYTGLYEVNVNPYVLDSKTVNSSTLQQVINSSADGLSSVTVNPYTVESDSSVLTANGHYEFTPTNADALDKVNVDVSIYIPSIQALRLVDSSTVRQEVRAVSGFDGVQLVIVEPYTLDSKTVDSSTVSQVITSDEDGLSSVTVNPYTVEQITVNAATSEQTITPQNADAISSVTVNAAPLQQRTVDASTVSLDIARTMQSYYGLSHVYINPVTAAIDSNIAAGNIKDGVTILGVTGTYEGTVINNQSKTVNPSTNEQIVTPDSGYTGLSSVTVNPNAGELHISPFTYADPDSSVIQSCSGYATVKVDMPYAKRKDITPTTYAQTFRPYMSDFCDYYDLVKVNAVDASIDANIQAGNIKSGVTILGVTGSYAGNNQSKTVDSSTVSQDVTPDNGYTGLSKVTVNPYILQDKILDFNSDIQWDPSTHAAIITPDSGYDGLSSVGVTMESKTVDPSTSAQMITPTEDSSYFALDSVYIRPVTASIDSNIAAGNIKDGVTILGVTGSYAGNNQSKTVDSSTVSQTVSPDNGYTGLSSVTVNPYRVGSIDITSRLDYTYYYSGSTTGITPGGAGMNVNGFDYVYWHSPKVTSKTVNPSTGQQTFSPTDEQYQYYSGITVNAVTSSIDSNITAGNIKKDVTILGVTGTFEGGAPEYDAIYNALIQI